MLLNSNYILMPPKALNPRSLLFVAVREMLHSTKMGLSLWNYQKDKIVKGMTFSL